MQERMRDPRLAVGHLQEEVHAVQEGPWGCDRAGPKGRAAGLLRVGVGLGVLLSALAGCATQRVTNPERTATEQFLLSKAVTEAVGPLSFDVLHGRKVYLDDRFFGAPEKAFVLGELRARLLVSGAQVAPDAKEAEIILEVRSAGIGIDRYDSLIGIPSFGAPAGATSAATSVPMIGFVTPEVAIVKETKQLSFASVAYVAYWANTGEVVASSGPSLGTAWRDDWWVLGFGPRTIGTIPPVEHRLE
jgi:hypothetical protein